MTTPKVVFLFDVDNTLLDNDRVTADLKRHLEQMMGQERQENYWAIFERLRMELGYADYLGALQRYRVEHPREPQVLTVSHFLVNSEFIKWSLMTMRPSVSSRMLKREASFVKRPSFPDSNASRFRLHEQRGLVLLVASVLAGLLACGRTPEQTSEAKQAVVAERPGVLHLTAEELARTVIEVAPVVRGQLLVPREFPATVQANENELAEVTTLIRGRVVKVHVDVGQDVKKDTLLAMLHSTDLGMAEGAYLKAVAKLHEAELAYERARGLHEEKVISLAELQRREAAMKTARAETREARNRLELLGVPRQEIERLDREHTIKADVSLRAPFDGRVIMRNITRGEVIEVEQKLFTVADLSAVWVVGNVPEKDVQYIHKDQRVDVIASAYPHGIFQGTITYIGDVLDPTTRTMRLRVTVLNPDRLLKPEMFAAVRVYAAATPDALTLPLEAVQNGPTGTIVFVQRGPNDFEVRAVKVGNEQGEVVTVLEGVSAGEQVVTKGSFMLKSEMERHKIEPTL